MSTELTPAQKQARSKRAGMLPARPLGLAIRRLSTRTGHSEIELADIIGIDPRQIYRWGIGECPMVTLEIADLVMTRLGLLWWDIWNEDTVRCPHITVLLRKVQRKKHTGKGRHYDAVIRSERYYGDAGTDWLTLRRVERLMDPPLDDETLGWVA